MAVDGDKINENKGRRRGFRRKKLQINEKVEVRSVEDGFMGSWHPGTVIRSGRQLRHVRYDNVLDDDGVNYLVEVVGVSNVLDGVGSSSSDSCYERGFIRPVPPPVQFGATDLPFGLCVDVEHDEAWWEGVVLDHSNGTKERSVFFPDLGDEMEVRIDQLRITQDWNEATGNWEPRGKWVLLELYEECHRKSYVPVSIKQIWYDVRTRDDFDRIGEWTRNVKDLWREPVAEVIDDYYVITLKELQPLLSLPMDFNTETPELESSSSEEATDHVVVHGDDGGGASQSNVLVSDIGTSEIPDENGDGSSNLLDATGQIQICDEDPLGDETSDNEIPQQPVEDEAPLQELLHESQKEMSIYDAGEAVSGGGIGKQSKKRRRRDSIVWRPLILSDLEYCPEVITQYADGCKSKKIREDLKTKVRKHLAYLGWTIEWTESKQFTEHKRYRYKSPEADDKKVYTSIIEVIKHNYNQMDAMVPQLDENTVPSAAASADCKILNLLSDQTNVNQELDVDPHTSEPSPGNVEDETDFCPEAVVKFYFHILENNQHGKKEWRAKARKHLLAEGWYIEGSTPIRKTILYNSPQEQLVGSLQGACRFYLKENIPKWTNSGRESNEANADHVVTNDLLLSVYQLLEREPKLKSINGGVGEGSSTEKPTGGVGEGSSTETGGVGEGSSTETGGVGEGSSTEKPTEDRKRKSPMELKASKPKRQRNDDELPEEVLNSSSEPKRNDELAIEVVRSSQTSKSKRQRNDDELPIQVLTSSKASGAKCQRKDETPTRVLRSNKASGPNMNDELPIMVQKSSKASGPKHRRNDEMPTHVLRSLKRVHEVDSPSLVQPNPQNVLAWLIENNKVFPRYKVFCYTEEGGKVYIAATGRIKHEGIKCSCCQMLYGLEGFVNHASVRSDNRIVNYANIRSEHCRPSSIIFLKDGRSLLDCMMEVMREHRVGEIMDKPSDDPFQGENDNICTVCNYGGELILCDRCPSSFHQSCLGLEDIPDGDWFCPSCRCGSCGQMNIEGTENGQFLTCIQCEHRYHVECQRNRAGDNLGSCQKNWLCSEECQKIHTGLRDMLGQEVLVGENGLTWTLLKLDSTESNLKAEHYSRLSVALSVMHECFEPLENPFSTGDLMQEVIFSQRSVLNRLNFQGFYTVLLERNDELISVATIRVFGKKVAEVPLVATRLQYRRLGMCRVLMDELEKKLTTLGVERLVLPAVPDVLQTWTNSFGFAEMTNADRSQFLDCTFLDFQGTTMCQKMLTSTPTPDSDVTRETLSKPGDVVFSVKCRIDFDKSSPISEVDQAEETHKSSNIALQVI